MKSRLIAISIMFFMPILFSFIYPTRKQLLDMKGMESIQILDRNGVLLREVLSQQDAISHYAKLEDISPWLVYATLSSEDKRFFMHRGLDPLASLRALYQYIVQRHIISGGSTITQQLARNILGSPSRSILYKIMEAGFALNMEMKLTKEEILELYFNYAPYGNQTYGIEAASYMYFRKPARHLSLSEAVFLTGIPKAPSYYNPYKHPERINRESTRVLQALLDQGIVDSLQYNQARTRCIELIPRIQNFKAPHFCEYVLAQLRERHGCAMNTVATTIDYAIQERVESILQNNINRLKDANVTNAAALVLDCQTLEILSYVGSVDFFDPLIDGEVDGVQSLRQPGSALKPFTYAIALEKGAHAATLIPDIPTYETTYGGDYRPRNYDEKYHGLVRLRTALACSYNIPAVRVCSTFGPEMLLMRLRQLGFESLDRSPIYYGIGLTLGNGEVTLLELTRAYSVFAHYGHVRDIHSIYTLSNDPRELESSAKHVFSPQIAYIITDILADNNARSPAFTEYSPLNLPFFCSVKTGTSKDYRDNWCVGFTDQYIVGVWVGNFDGSPMHNVSGITGAAPIFRDIMLMLHRDDMPGAFIPPKGLEYHRMCAISGELACENCMNCIKELFVPGSAPTTICHIHKNQEQNNWQTAVGGYMEGGKEIPFAISFPDDHDIFKIDPILHREHQRLCFQVHTSLSLVKVTWYVDDKNIGTTKHPFTILWQLTPGQHEIVAQGINQDNRTTYTSQVTITVLE